MPRLRLPRATIADAMAWVNPPARKPPSGSRAVCNWDEDALTMAVQAGRNCLRDAARAGSVVFCSTTPPFADRDPAVLVAAALDLPETCGTTNIGGSMRAGTSGLLAARRCDDHPTLFIASDTRLTKPGSPQELTYGDAAVAYLIGPPADDSLATIIDSRSVATDFVDHYRMNGSDFDYALEERWVRDEGLMTRLPALLTEMLAAAGHSAADVKHLVLPTSTPTATRLAQACGLSAARRDDRATADCGDAGVAMSLLMLACTLEGAEPGDLIVVLGLGQGIDVLLLRAEFGVRNAVFASTALACRREESSYIRYLSHRDLLAVDFGMRAERDQRTAHTVAYRKRDAITGFKGGRCAKCGTVQFPLSRVCVNPACRETDSQTPHRLADGAGRIKSFTEDWQAYAARPPYLYGNVEFAEGGNLLMEFTDAEAGELRVNDVVRFVYRIKDEDRARGFRRYFWKATRA